MRHLCKNIRKGRATYIHNNTTIAHLLVHYAYNKIKSSQKILRCNIYLKFKAYKPILIKDMMLAAQHLDNSIRW